LRSYSHGDVATLLNIATELDIVSIFNKHVPAGKNGKRQMRDGLTVGATFLLGAIGRACCPTSKDGWYDWCKDTSLEYCFRRSFKALDSQHFWDQMNALPVDRIALGLKKTLWLSSLRSTTWNSTPCYLIRRTFLRLLTAPMGVVISRDAARISRSATI
jgi:hypothetical protein